MKDSLYHKSLRICALTLSLVLLFASGVFSPVTKQLSDDAGVYVATAIGINAAVLPTEVNTLSAQLLDRERELNEREIAVNLKEANAESSDLSTFIMSVLLFILLVLIVLNYALDYIRGKQRVTLKAS